MNIYHFSKVETVNSFDDGFTDILYFPITESTVFTIRNKAEELINEIIYNYKKNTGFNIDTSKFYLDARMISFKNTNGLIENEISVIISDEEDLFFEKEYKVIPSDELYIPFKTYFMEQLEKICFPQ